jgi:hypothetical protein
MSRFANLNADQYSSRSSSNGRQNYSQNEQRNYGSTRQQKGINLFRASHRPEKKPVIRPPANTAAEFPHLSTGVFVKPVDLSGDIYLEKITTLQPEPTTPISKNKFETLQPGWVELSGTSNYNPDEDEDQYQIITALTNLHMSRTHDHVRTYGHTLGGTTNYAYILPEMDIYEFENYIAPNYELFDDLDNDLDEITVE